MADAVPTGAMFNSVFGVTSGTTLDTKSGKTISIDGVDTPSGGRLKLNGVGNTSAKSVKIATTSAGKFRFACQSANNSSTNRTYEIATSKEILFTSAEGVSASTYAFYEYDLPAAGTYFLYSPVNGFNIYYLEFTQKVALGDLTGFTLSTNAVNTDYLTGDVFDATGLEVLETYSSGATLALDASKYTIDSKAFNSNAAGEYSIIVKYSTFPNQEFKVTVHAVNSLKVYSTPTNSGSAGSKTVNRTRKVYKIDEVVSTANITAKAVSNDGYSKIVTAAVALPNTATAGLKDVTFTYDNLGTTYQDSFSIIVVDSSLLVKDASEYYTVSVNAASAANGEVTDGLLNFKSIQDAHDFLSVTTADADLKKIIIASGTYEEKLYLDIPNLTIAAKDATNMPIVEYGACSDTQDSNGVNWSTFGSSAVTVQTTATSFKATNIIFKNSKYITMDDYASGSGNQQACAIVTRADGAIYTNCAFRGFQDTLYINAGTPTFDRCSISGMTDYIFGEADNALFISCDIVSLNKGSLTNNGYVVAHKPGSAAPETGYYFRNCSLSSEAETEPGTISLARSWSANAKVTFDTCSMDAGFSKEAYPNTSGSGKNTRWGEMSGNKPTSSDYAEYASSGEGAITEAVAGGKIMTAEEQTALLAKVKTLFGYNG